MSNTPANDKRNTERRQGDRRIVEISVHPDRRSTDRRLRERRIELAH
ncbi:MAG TPA: hypothetical protein VMA98_00240 [Candidatus Acidoferrales bacterium]|nr:hypothetical protein [Candidatus Acidoferrales bacterium]